MNKEGQILIVEDDPDIAELIEINIDELGYTLDKAVDGKEGLDKALNGEYVLIILDLMLPTINGIEVCKQIRAKDAYTPILMLTARSEEFDKVLGLEVGADDYLTKPFSIRELLARIKAAIRRLRVDSKFNADELPDKKMDFGPLIIEPAKRKILLDDRMLDLTPKEFELLVLFASNPGKTFSRGELLKKVWGYQFEGYDHTVNSHINRLRNKIEKDPSQPAFLKTVWGVGYRFTEREELKE